MEFSSYICTCHFGIGKGIIEFHAVVVLIRGRSSRLVATIHRITHHDKIADRAALAEQISCRITVVILGLGRRRRVVGGKNIASSIGFKIKPIKIGIYRFRQKYQRKASLLDQLGKIRHIDLAARTHSIFSNQCSLRLKIGHIGIAKGRLVYSISIKKIYRNLLLSYPAIGNGKVNRGCLVDTALKVGGKHDIFRAANAVQFKNICVAEHAVGICR